MRKLNDTVIVSASDLVNFTECRHLTSLDLIDLDTPLPRASEEEEMLLIAGKGHVHERNHLATLKTEHRSVFEVPNDLDDDAAAAATLEAMRRGDEIIYQAMLKSGNLVGHADFLRKVPGPSGLGAHAYEVADTKLARSPRAKFLVQLSFYSDLLEQAQGVRPLLTHVVLGNGQQVNYRVVDFLHYYARLKAGLLDHIERRPETYPHPCERCEICHWRDLCQERRRKDDHLIQVADIRKIQIRRLQAAGIDTLEALANSAEHASVPKMIPESFAKLRRQAKLQLEYRRTGKRSFELLATALAPGKGLLRLPQPSEGDVFFDIEGDPLEDGGLEYLLGALYIQDDKPSYRAFWSHSRAEERQAFEAFMDFVSERLRRYPDMHIYHYASYEATALKRLMTLHGTREADVDDLLRRGTLIDLYKVVRESMRTSEPGYSLKNIEGFYMPPRQDDVKTAGASIVYYEKWKETRDKALLESIRAYNERDCASTLALTKWLMTVAQAAPARFTPAPVAEPEEGQPSEKTRRIEEQLRAFRELLVEGLPQDRSAWGSDEQLRELAYFLLDFHRRAAKPAWWALFARQDMSEEELIEDPECIGAMTQVGPPAIQKQSGIYTYAFPPQDFKLKRGEGCTRTDNAESAGTIVDLDEDAGRISIKRALRRGPLPERLSIGPSGPINSDKLAAAVARFAGAIAKGADRYGALRAFLERRAPSLRGRVPGAPVVKESRDVIDETIEAVDRLEDSYLFVQGPPGAGKTYTGSRIVVELLRRGRRVGISSNSHKAINNLLAAIEREASRTGFVFSGAKKSTGGDPDTYFNGDIVEDFADAGEIIEGSHRLIAGTAWLFAEPGLDQSLDVLFVDEAGQVALANLVAMGTSARNIVLLGDQMQLGQPIQGTHPGRSGASALEHLLDGEATVAPERGVFLKRTWRMHSDICRFISEAVYDGRLEPEAHTANQRLVLNADAHPALRSTGIRFLDAEHDGCSQRSEEEAGLVRELYGSLLRQRYIDRDGVGHAMGMDNILVVAPYNMQVNLLKRMLPDGARVGTVDKFQGQEAEVVIVSMATSSEDYMPRHLDFLFSRNRLNVAISRARCLSIVIANPRLLDVPCRTPEQMALVNTLCWARSYSMDDQR